MKCRKKAVPFQIGINGTILWPWLRPVKPNSYVNTLCVQSQHPTFRWVWKKWVCHIYQETLVELKKKKKRCDWTYDWRPFYLQRHVCIQRLKQHDTALYSPINVTVYLFMATLSKETLSLYLSSGIFVAEILEYIWLNDCVNYFLCLIFQLC